MNQLLRIKQVVQTAASGTPCEIEQYLGGGGQGEVYKARIGNGHVALKWYFPQTVSVDGRLQKRLQQAIESGPPSDRFLWPRELATADGLPTFGYIMALREPRFASIVDLVKRRIEPTFRALATAGFELAHNYLQLHSKGMCYRDISFGNAFFDPETGEVRICDNDNVDINGQPGPVGGTPRFMAPEIVRGDAAPSIETDLFSLAVLLFYMLTVHHPLEGKQELAIHSLDAPAMRQLYGTKARFIFDPEDHSNEPVPGYHDNALAFWPMYPEFLRERFTRAFTDGIREPDQRVRETEWRQAMIRLRDSIVYCQHCRTENFYDTEALRASGGKPMTCWACASEVRLPGRIRIGANIVMLNHDTQLFPHHVDDHRSYDFSAPVAAMAQHPTNHNVWGLKNLTREIWVLKTADGTMREVEPGRSASLATGSKIHFGSGEGEIRM